MYLCCGIINLLKAEFRWVQMGDELRNTPDYQLMPLLTKVISGNFSFLGLYDKSGKYVMWVSPSAGAG